jgi:hypothetical protein
VGVGQAIRTAPYRQDTMASLIGLIFPKFIPAATIENFGVRTADIDGSTVEPEVGASASEAEQATDLDDLLDGRQPSG